MAPRLPIQEYCGVRLADCHWFNETRDHLAEIRPLVECGSDSGASDGHNPMLDKFYLNEISMGSAGCVLNAFLFFFFLHMYRRNRLDCIRHAPLVIALVLNDIITGVVITSCAVALISLDSRQSPKLQTRLVSLRNTIVVTPAGPCICYITIALSQCLALAKPFFYEVHLTPSLFRGISILAMTLGIGLWAVILVIRHVLDDVIHKHIMGEDPTRVLFWVNLEYGVTVGFLLIFISLTLCTFTMVSCVLWRRNHWNRSKHGRLFRLLRMEVCVYCIGAAVVTGCCVAYYTITSRVVSTRDEDCAQLYLTFERGYNSMLTTTIVQYAAIQVWLLRIIIEPLIHLFCNRNIRSHLLIVLGLRKDNSRGKSIYATAGGAISRMSEYTPSPNIARCARSRNNSLSPDARSISSRLTADHRLRTAARSKDRDFITGSQLLIPPTNQARASFSSA